MNPKDPTQPLQQTFVSLIHESQIPSGEIKPTHLAATPIQANGDIYYSDGSKFVRLPAGSSGQVFTISGGIPSYATPTPATPLSSKVITATRDLTLAAGDVAYTGVGFVPTSIIAMGNIDATAFISWGVSDSSKTNKLMELGSTANQFNTTTALIFMNPAGGAVQQGVIKTYDADGFTLTWTKAGAPTGTANLVFLCFK